MGLNELFPVFLRVDRLRVLLVGGGAVALEKLNVLIKSYLDIHITLVADSVRPEIRKTIRHKSNIKLLERKFLYNDLKGVDIVFLATNDHDLHKRIVDVTRPRNILVNVADSPELCDFYLGSVVQKGDLKIAISTNGKSPTLAKRLREFLEEIMPDRINDLIRNLNQYRNQLKGDFQTKVEELNDLTKSLLN